MNVEVEVWARIIGSDEMQLLGTIDYSLEGTDLPIGVPTFRASLEDFVNQVNEVMSDLAAQH